MRRFSCVVIMMVGCLCACVNAAVLNDDAQTTALWHMDQVVSQNFVNWSSGIDYGNRNWVADDSSARPGIHNDLLLGSKAGFVTDTAIINSSPTIVTGMNGYGNALSFDGSDVAILTKAGGAWGGYDSVIIDMWVKPTSNAVEGDVIYIGGTQTVVETRWTTAKAFKTWFFNSAGGYSSVTVVGVLNDWNHIVITANGNSYSQEVTPLSTGITKTLSGNLAAGTVLINSSITANVLGEILVGSKALVRPFTGLIDELDVKVVPEPVSALLLGIGGLLALRNRKK
jgi:hypothetical protein